MIIGYNLSGWDNKSWMTGTCEKLFPELTDIPKCKVCGYRTDYRYNNPGFVLKRKTFDFSSTFDNITIVSLRFKDFCEKNSYENLVFIPLLKTPNFFQFYIKGNVIEFTAYSKENYCESCEQFESIIGPGIKLEKIDKPLTDGFYQSDLWFASGNEKSPITIIAPETFKKMKAEKFKGTGGAFSIEKKDISKNNKAPRLEA